MSNIILENLEEKHDSFSISLNSPGIFYYICYGFLDGEKSITVHIESDNIEAHILGLLIGTTGSCSLNTLQHHTAPNSMSKLHIKSILTGDASLSYRGMIQIDKQAQQSNAYQQNDNLILSPKAHIDTKPELEIIANDVKCSHGATIGQLDDEQIYYLQSRGVTEEEARQLALTGFAQDIIMKITDKEIQKQLNQFITRALHEVKTEDSPVSD